MRLNPDPSADIVSAVWTAQRAEQTALEQMSTGKRVNRPSDDPAAASQLVLNHASSSRTDQYRQNVSTILGQLQNADSSLSTAVTTLQSAVTLGVQGANDTMSAINRQQIAKQVLGLRDQMLQVANLSYAGNFVFGGTATKTPPYVLDSTVPSGVKYVGDNGTNTVAVGDNNFIQVNLPGSDVFSSNGTDVFGALQQLATALTTGTSTQIGTATTALRDALNSVSQQRVFYGNAMNQLNAQDTYLQQEKVQLSSQENSLVGADLTKAATDLNQAQTAHSAALAAAAKVLPMSLLDYL